jgi:hypothetical protein
MVKTKVVVLLNIVLCAGCFFLTLEFSPFDSAFIVALWPFVIVPGINYLLRRLTGVDAINVVTDSLLNKENKG